MLESQYVKHIMLTLCDDIQGSLGLTFYIDIEPFCLFVRVILAPLSGHIQRYFHLLLNIFICLQLLSCVCVSRLQDVVHCEKRLYLVFEYLDLDLKKHMDTCPDLAKDPRLIKVWLACSASMSMRSRLDSSNGMKFNSGRYVDT
jgi:hypothetical protein